MHVRGYVYRHRSKCHMLLLTNQIDGFACMSAMKQSCVPLLGRWNWVQNPRISRTMNHGPLGGWCLVGLPTHPCILLPPNWSPPEAIGGHTGPPQASKVFHRPLVATRKSLPIYFQVHEGDFLFHLEACRGMVLEREVGHGIFQCRKGKGEFGKGEFENSWTALMTRQCTVESESSDDKNDGSSS